MKATEVLRRYEQEERDFRRVSLRGQSFKEQNLSGADFSETDIRSANFTSANLQRAKFCGAKAGLDKNWIVVLVISSFFLSALSGLLATFGGGATAATLGGEFALTKGYTLGPGLTGVAVFVGLVFLFSFIVRQKLITFLGVFSGVLSSLAVFFLIITAIVGTLGGKEDAGKIYEAYAFVIFATMIVVYVGAGIHALSLAVVNAQDRKPIESWSGFLLSAIVSSSIGIKVWGNLTYGGTLGCLSLAGAYAGLLALLGRRVSLRSQSGNEQYVLIKQIAIAFAAIGGTSFRGADLTDAVFTGARLNCTDFRKATLIRTCWFEAKMLDRVRPGDTYLKNAQVRQWLIGKGRDRNFDRQNLRGVNFQGSNLKDASFIGTDLSEANLQDADLSKAKLVQTQLDGTDFTGSTLTGAFIEDWGITSSTKLNGVRCKYVFMRLPPEKRPSWLALPVEESLDPNPRRKPDNWSEEFEDGDFADFIKPIVDTLDLYHNQGVDPRAIAISFKELAENNPQAELRVVAMEARGGDKFLLRAKTAPDANHSQLSAEYFDTYNQFKGLPESEIRKLLLEKDIRLIEKDVRIKERDKLIRKLESERDKVIRKLESMVETALERPSFYAKTYHHRGDIMLEESRINVSAGGSIGAVGGGDVDVSGVMNLGTISGNVTNAIDELPSSSSSERAGIKELLSQLQGAIEAEANLDDEGKAEALKQVEILAKAGKNPKNETMQKKAKKAVGFLQVIADGIEPVTKLAKACSRLIPAIAAFFAI